MRTDDLLVPQCPTWCDHNHEPFLGLQDEPGTAWVVTHTRQLASQADVWVELVQDEPHPAMRVQDGYADPADFPSGARVVLGAEQQMEVRPQELRDLAAALVQAAMAAESWGVR